MKTIAGMLRNFPGLGTLWPSGVPFIAQSAPGECGPACLAMLACHYGRATDIPELMALSGGSRLGLRMGELQDLSRRIGIDARIVKLHEVSELRWLDRPVILHWRFCHFVVLESYDGRRARILDPALGAMDIDRAELEASYTGLLLWLDPADAKPAAAAPPRKPLLPFLRRFAGNLPELPGLLAICVLLQLLGLAPALISAWALGSLVPQHQAGMLPLLACGVLVIAAMGPLSELARNHLVVQVRSVLGLRMVTTLVDHVLRSEWKALQQRPYGDLLNRIHANEEIRALLTSTGVALALDGLLGVLSLALLLLISPTVAALVLLCSTIAGLGFVAMHRRRARELVELFGQQSRSQGYLVQMLMGMETIRASGMAAGVRRRWSALFGNATAASAALGRTEGRIAALSAALTGSAGLVVLFAITVLALRQALSLPQALLAYSLSATLLGTAGRLFLGVQHLQSVGFQATLAQDLLDLPLQQDGGRAPAEGSALACRGVGFAHAANVAPTLAGVELDVPAGGLVAIVGPSGSGKSTLLNVLAGLYPAHSGAVLLGGEDIAAVDPAQLRSRVLLVPQFPYFFAHSIRENLELARPGATLAEIRDAARQACIAEEIEALPMGYETVLAEGGVGLSGGQRQRLALARAILARPAVLLLDEATSSLDARSEQGVLERLSALQCTRVIAAHRLSTVRAADTILVLEAGRIVQSGSFAQLVQQPGAFRRLFGRQLHHGEGEADAA
jgi:ATP-binding cassette subfamily B protein